MDKNYVVEKDFKISKNNISLLRAPHFGIEKTKFDEKADVAETDDISFKPISERDEKFRQGFLVKDIPDEPEDFEITVKDVVTPLDIDIIDAAILGENFFVFFRKLGEYKQGAGVFNMETLEIIEVDAPKESRLLEISTDLVSKASTLWLENSKYRIMSYDFDSKGVLLNSHEVYTSDRTKSSIKGLKYKDGNLSFNLRKNYRNKEINGVPTSTNPKNQNNLHVNSTYDYALMFNEGLHQINNNNKENSNKLHISLNCYTGSSFDDFDFLIDKGFEILKIERDFSKAYIREVSNKLKKSVIKAIKAHLEEMDLVPKTLTISATGFAGIPAIDLIEDLEKSLKIKVSSIVFKDLPANLITYKHTSCFGRDMTNLSDMDMWRSSPMSRADSFRTPALLIADKANNDIWYGSTLAMYSSLKYFGKDCRCVLAKQNPLKSDDVKNIIYDYLTEKSK